MKKFFDSTTIDVILEGNRILFNVDNVAYAVGYAKPASLEHHIRGIKAYDIIAKNGKRYTTSKGLRHAADCAVRTPALRRLAEWASKIKKADMISADVTWPGKAEAKPVKPPVKTEGVKARQLNLYGIRDAAAKLGMSAKELADWLVNQGHAGRYASNNSLYWKEIFETQGLGTRPMIGGGLTLRQSNVAKLTESGFNFVKNRLNSERQTGVLAFAKKEANEAEKLEAEVEALIKTTFAPTLEKSKYADLLGSPKEYIVNEATLIKNVKSIIAQVKLKEKKT